MEKPFIDFMNTINGIFQTALDEKPQESEASDD